MERCDVLIVGGGPAGSSCAWKLTGSGLDVLILDRKTFPRDKPCAGWITPALVEALQLDLDDYRGDGTTTSPKRERGDGVPSLALRAGVEPPAARVLQPITSFVVGMIGGREVEAAYDKPISYGIRRFEFDDYLLRRSKARLRLGEGGETPERGRAGRGGHRGVGARAGVRGRGG